MCKNYELKPMIFQETLSLFYLLQYHRKTDHAFTHLTKVARRMLGTWTRLLSYWHYRNQVTALRSYLEQLMQCVALVGELKTVSDLSPLKNQLSKITALIQQLITETAVFSQSPDKPLSKGTPSPIRIPTHPTHLMGSAAHTAHETPIPK